MSHESMRILHLVSYAVLSGPLPGVLVLARAQRTAGHTAYVAHDGWRGNFSPYEEGADAAVRAAGVAPPWPLTLSAKGGLCRAGTDLVTLQRIMRRGEVDVVHAHLSHDHLLAALARAGRTTLVRTVHAERGLRPRLGSGPMWRRTHAMVVRAEAQLPAAARLGMSWRGRPMPIQAIAGSLEAGRFGRPGDVAAGRALRARLGIPPGARVLGHVALMASRGQGALIEALAALAGRGAGKGANAGHARAPAGPQALPHLLFVGRGPDEVALRRRVHGSPLARHVHFAGYCQGEALAHAYGAMDGAFVAQPGNDGAARAALEAAASGLPLLLVPVGALADLAGPTDAVVAAEASPGAIAAALAAWADDPEGMRARGARAQAWVRRSRAPALEAAATCALYRSAAARMDPPGGPSGDLPALGHRCTSAAGPGRSSAW